MIKVITYGTYDLLHQGHINLLRRAKELGDYLIVGVTSDSFDQGRGKLNVRNNVLERVEAVKATGFADEVIIEDYTGQRIDDIQKYDVDIFAIDAGDIPHRHCRLRPYCAAVRPRVEGRQRCRGRLCLNPDAAAADAFAREFGLQTYSAFDDFIEGVEAVYIASPHLTHYAYAKRA